MRLKLEEKIESLWSIRFAASLAFIAGLPASYHWNLWFLALVYFAARWRINVLKNRLNQGDERCN
jgi:hypothetical protein